MYLSGVMTGLNEIFVVFHYLNCITLVLFVLSSHSIPCLSLSFQVGNVVSFQCQPGHLIQGSSSRTCQPDLMWTGFQPECIRRKHSSYHPVNLSPIHPLSVRLLTPVHKSPLPLQPTPANSRRARSMWTWWGWTCLVLATPWCTAVSMATSWQEVLSTESARTTAPGRERCLYVEVRNINQCMTWMCMFLSF